MDVSSGQKSFIKSFKYAESSKSRLEILYTNFFNKCLWLKKNKLLYSPCILNHVEEFMQPNVDQTYKNVQSLEKYPNFYPKCPCL